MDTCSCGCQTFENEYILNEKHTSQGHFKWVLKTCVHCKEQHVTKTPC